VIPLVDLSRQHTPLGDELRAAFDTVLTSERYHLGPETEAFEREFAQHEGADFGICCGSGSDALYLALRALDIGTGDAVVTVSNSFLATAESIARTGADVLFAEPDPRTHSLDPDDLVRLLREPGGERVKAIIPVHLYGRRADIDGIRGALRQTGHSEVAVLGDAAQAHGSPGVGGETDITCYSFYPSKNLGALGDGGIVLCRDPAVDARIRSLRNHGRAGKHDSRELGLNSRFDEIQAACLRIKLRHLSRWNGQRRALAEGYRQRLGVTVGLHLPSDAPGHVYHLFVVQIAGSEGARDRVAGHLRRAEIGVGLHYPVAVHQMSLYPATRPLPVTERLVSRVLTLPMFPGMRDDELDRVCYVLLEALAAETKGA
jgi:dTDP-4-amino-4,6-dideoxygalactose transaminase